MKECRTGGMDDMGGDNDMKGMKEVVVIRGDDMK